MQTSKLPLTTEEWPRHMRITSLVLMSLLTPKTHAHWARPYPIDTPVTRKHHAHQTHPYLAVIGSLPLRFASVKPSPVFSIRPPAGGADEIDEPHKIDVDRPTPQLEPALPIEKMPIEQKITPVPVVAIEPKVISKKKTPSVIIPDDGPPRTKHEDFLPFFKFPNQSGDVTVVVPAPDQPATPPSLPRSSATYKQR